MSIMHVLFLLIIAKSVVRIKSQNLPSKRITLPKYPYQPSLEPTAYVPPSIATFSNDFAPAFIPTNYFSSNKIPKVNALKASAFAKIELSTKAPTKVPTVALKTVKPSKLPTSLPKISPTTSPTTAPTLSPSAKPTSKQASKKPSRIPTIVPTTSSPSFSPINSPPTYVPSTRNTNLPSRKPSILTTKVSSTKPTKSTAPTSTSPSRKPSILTTRVPSTSPTKSSAPTSTSPSRKPSISTTRVPSTLPTKSSLTSKSPSRLPTLSPTSPSKSNVLSSSTPTKRTVWSPSFSPTKIPSTSIPSISPSKSTASPSVSRAPVKPTSKPSPLLPSKIAPTRSPSKTSRPTKNRNELKPAPTVKPSSQPSFVSREDDVTYHNNGSVILSPKIYNIYVGPFSTTTMDLIDYLASNLHRGTPNWYSVVRSYSQVRNGKVSYVGMPTFVERWTFNPSITRVSDEIFQSLIGPTIASKGLLNCTECIFAIIFNGGFQMPGWNGQSGYAPFCGYHLLFGYDVNGVSYTANIAVVGDPMTTKPNPYYSCVSNTYGVTANNDPSGDSIATTYMHEIAECITDYDGNTWYSDSNGYEIADLCNFHFGDEFDITTQNYNYQFGQKKFLVQTLFETRMGCVSEFKMHAGSNQNTYRPVVSPTKSPSLPEDLSFHEPGGLVVDPNQQFGVTLINVYLGSISESTKQLTDYFGSHISTTSWYQTLTTYFDYLGPRGWVHFNTGFSMGQSVNIQPTGQALQLTETDIQNYLLPLYNANVTTTTNTPYDVYAVMFRGDFNISIGGKLWLRDWCSYHGSFLILPAKYLFRYFLVGDPSTAPGLLGRACAPISGNGRVTANGDLGGDSIAVGYAQQLAQTLTNSQHYTWFSDSDGFEVSSACLGNFGPGFNLAKNNSNIVVGNKKFLVQEIWKRGEGCTMRF